MSTKGWTYLATSGFLLDVPHPWIIPLLNSPKSSMLPNQSIQCCVGHSNIPCFQNALVPQLLGWQPTLAFLLPLRSLLLSLLVGPFHLIPSQVLFCFFSRGSNLCPVLFSFYTRSVGDYVATQSSTHLTCFRLYPLVCLRFCHQQVYQRNVCWAPNPHGLNL